MADGSCSPAEVDVRKIRKGTGATQEKFAAGIGVPVKTVRNWEQQEGRPVKTGAFVLLAMVAADPTIIMRTLGRHPSVIGSAVASRPPSWRRRGAQRIAHRSCGSSCRC